jgi:hypothetical protein
MKSVMMSDSTNEAIIEFRVYSRLNKLKNEK